MATDWRPSVLESFDVRMSALSNVAKLGTSICPIHRLIHGIDGFDAEGFLAETSEHCGVEQHVSFEAMSDVVDVGREKHTFECFAPPIFTTLRLRDESELGDLIPGNQLSGYKRRNVSILHRILRAGLPVMDAMAFEEQRNVTCTVDLAADRQSLEAGAEQLLFYLNPTSPNEVTCAAEQWMKVPRRSTGFYPKFQTGLGLTTMEIAKSRDSAAARLLRNDRRSYKCLMERGQSDKPVFAWPSAADKAQLGRFLLCF